MTKTTSKNIAGRAVAAVLALAVAAWGGAWATGYAITGNANPAKWKDKQTTTTTPRTVAISSDGQALTSGCTYDMPKGLAFLSARSFSSETTEYVAGGEITLTAELSNEYINGRFDWSVDFANPDAEWAQGKVASYYVGLEPIDDGRQVKMKYLAPFSEQIILTATLQDTKNSASCTVDCLYDVLQIEAICGWHFTDYVCLSETSRLSETGTVKGDFSFASLYCSIEERFQSEVKNFLNFDITFKAYYAAEFENCIPDNRENGFDMETNVEITPALFIKDFEAYDEEHQTAIKFAWYAANKATDNSNNAYFDFGINYNYNGIFCELLQESDIACCVNAHQYSDLAPSVTLNKNIVF